jgi:hypothetical protein
MIGIVMAALFITTVSGCVIRVCGCSVQIQILVALVLVVDLLDVGPDPVYLCLKHLLLDPVDLE